ncbi:MAG TPA: Ig-like domain-containing protein [Gemmataceae bacterium]|jgi:hypothetical protein|nr:Ig-like domain-containing protein [Gemmataceae bacterium]
MRHKFCPRLDKLEDRTAPAVFNVNSVADTSAVNLTTGVDASGNISVRSALDAVNHLGGLNTINVPAGTYLLSLGELNINGSPTKDNVTIAGAGSGSTIIDAQNNSRVFQVFSGNTAAFSDVTIQHGATTISGGGLFNNNGTVTIANSIVADNSANGSFGRGGGLFNAGGMTLTNVTFSHNAGTSDARGGGMWNGGTMTITGSTFADNYTTGSFGYGGGIFNYTTLTATNCTFTNNSVTSGYGGGGIENQGTLILSGSTFTGNSATTGFDGGAIDNSSSATISDTTLSNNFGHAIYTAVGSMTLTRCVVNSNSLGGVFNHSGTLTVTDSTISNNAGSGLGNMLSSKMTVINCTIAGNTGGGISNSASATVSNTTISGNSGGRAINNGGGTLTLSNSTVADNTQGGISNASGTATLVNVTIANNSAGTFSGGGIDNISGTQLNLVNTIVAGNTASTAPDIRGAIATGRNNLIGDGTSMTGISNGDPNHNQVGSAGTPLDPHLNALANNGGATKTMALQAISTAIGASDLVTTVTQSATSAATSIVVANAASIALTAGHYQIFIDGEEMDVTSVNLATNALTVTRGVNGYTANTIAPADAVYLFSDQRGAQRAVPPDIGAYQFTPVPPSAVPDAPDLVNVSDSGIADNDDITNLDNSSPAKSLQFLVTGTVNGATVTVAADGVPIGTAIATGTTTIVTTNGSVDLTDGVRSITAHQKEPGKPVSSDSFALNVLIDTAAPTAPTSAPDLQAASDGGVSSTDNITDVTAPTFDVTSTDTYFRFYRNGTSIGGAYQSGNSYTPVTQADGSYTVSATAVDAAGNESTPSPTLNVTIDTAPPNAGSVNDGVSADINFQTSMTTINANWGGFSDSSSGISSYEWAIGTSAGNTDVMSFSNVGNATAATISGLNLTRNIRYFVSVRARDTAGNVSSLAISDGVTVFFPAPIIDSFSTDSGVLGDGITNDSTPTLNGHAEPGFVVQIYDGAGPLDTVTADIDGTWQYTTAALSEGDHSFRATASDGGGNTSDYCAPLNLKIDTMAPGVTIDRAIGQADPANAGPIVFHVSFTEPVTGFDSASVDLSASTVGGHPVANVTGSGTDYSIEVTGMDGTGTVVASIPVGAAQDAAGNGNTSPASGTVAFDNIAPSVAVNQSAGQSDPTFAGPIVFTVTFSEPVAGFTDADLDLSSSTVVGNLVAAVSGSGADYTISITGMHGAGNVVAAIPVGVAVDLAGNANAASTGSDNTVYFNHVGMLQFTDPIINVVEGVGNATITVTRINGGDDPVSVNFATSGGTATSDSDFTSTSGHLDWADGDSGPKTIEVPITDDVTNERSESFTLALTAPTGQAQLGAQSTTTVVIAKSDGASIAATDKLPQANIADSDGDLITLKLTGKVGSMTYYLTNGVGPIAEIELVGTDSSKSIVNLAIKKPKNGTGDGRVQIDEIHGAGAKRLNLAKADLNGVGIDLTSFLGSLAIGAVKNAADITLAGVPPTSSLSTKLTVGVVEDGTDILITGAPLGSLTATRIGAGTIAAPSVGAITVKGKAKTKTAAAIAGDFKSNLTIAGTGLAAKVPALKSLKVAGSVSGSTIQVGGLTGTVGDVGSVSVGAFVDSRLFAGYTGPDDGSGTFNLPSTVGSFVVTGKTKAFAHSYAIASNFKNVVLTSVDADNAGTKFGFLFDTLMKSLTVKSPAFKFDPAGPVEQHMSLGDFFVKKV